MKLNQTQLDIIHGKICPYCKAPAEYVDSESIYGVSFGMVYICRPCDAYVGTHKQDPKTALGRLANKELRGLKKQAHAHFDPLWKNNVMDRNQAYKLLSEHLKIPRQYTHIGMFGIETCQKVIEWAKKFQQ